MAKLRISRFLVFLGCTICFQTASAAPVAPANAAARLQAGQPVDLIVEYESSAIEQEATRRRMLAPRQLDDASVLDYKAARYRLFKQQIDSALPSPEITHKKDYSHLPMSLKHVRSRAALEALLSQPGIKAVYEDGQAYHNLAQSLPLAKQTAVAAVGQRGNGTTVAVIDDGIDYTRAEFGSCSAPGNPAACRVSASVEFGTGSSSNSHGTNVAAIVLGVAPDTRIAMLNVFSGTLANFSDIISALNWAIANRSANNIVAVNMSLGDGIRNTTPCSSNNPFATPLASVISAGMSVVASAGNETFTNGLGKPACTPGVISVGAVYDSNFGPITYGTLCGDTTTAADKVVCFSNSATFLSMLAPGALITAGGNTYAGTSQASPHVAGALAVLHSTFPAETPAQAQTRLVNNGTQVTDARNGVVKPRLNLLEAARPANNAFADRILLSGTAGSTSGGSLLATKETGEPAHAGNSGGASTWWTWTAPAGGQVSLGTHGSGFDTLLAVYTGTGVGALAPIAANDNDGTSGNASGLVFQAQAGTEYRIAVDGLNAAAGNVLLNWSLNTAASANLSLSLSGPADAPPGSIVTYSLVVTNAGPEIATNVVTTLALPAETSFVSGSAGCSADGALVTCQSGNIANGGSVTLTIQLLWGNGAATETLTASVGSDLPDPVPAGGNATIQVAVGDNNNDVPVLPWWGQLALATILIGVSAVARRGAPANHRLL